MPTKQSDIRARLDRLDAACAAGEDAEASMRAALADRHYLMVARAAELCADRLLYDLEDDLIAAYGRFLVNAIKNDPNCRAKEAITRALVTLDCQDVAFYEAGLAYHQLEPAWGGSNDTAADVRAHCAIGLAGTGYARAIVAFAELLHDPERAARIGALRAIRASVPLAAEALLRCKALAGDEDPAVIGECLVGLLELEPDESSVFVAGFLDDPDPSVRDLAALSLGESRTPSALARLRERWDSRPFKRDEDRILLRAAVLHRSDDAFGWLIDVIATGDDESAALVVSELAVYRTNDRLRERLAEAIERRGSTKLRDHFDEYWHRD